MMKELGDTFRSLWKEIRDFLHNLVFEEGRVWYNRNPGFGEVFLGVMRFLLLILMLVMFILYGGVTFQEFNARALAIQARQVSPLLHLIPLDFITFVIYIFSWQNLRFAFPMIGAVISVFIGGASFVKDIYNIKQLSDGLRYVIPSMFGINYPHVNIDKGEMQIGRKEVNLINAIGGPGYATIQPGNAVLFHKLRKVSRNIITQSVLMTRFERVGEITNLDEQDGYVEEIQVVTRDGIQIKLRDVRYRYRILSEMVNGKPLPRTKENPYPFSVNAFISLSYYLSVNDSGQISWGQAVRQMVTGVIEDYIASHGIDELTAPRDHRFDPRREISELLFGPGLTGALRNAGTQLLWADIGHFDIVAEDIDRERINLWAAEWAGDAEIKRASGEANRMALTELGRAEGQAEMLVGIAQALRNIDTEGNRAQTVRNVLLARTAQILEAMRDNRMQDDRPSGGSNR